MAPVLRAVKLTITSVDKSNHSDTLLRSARFLNALTADGSDEAIPSNDVAEHGSLSVQGVFRFTTMLLG